MKSGTSYRTLQFVIYKLITFAVVFGLQNLLLYILTHSCAALPVALPQYQAEVGGATVAFVESFQLNAFDTTRTTLPSATSAIFETAGGTSISSLRASSSFATSFATSLQPSFSSQASGSSSPWSSSSSSASTSLAVPAYSSSSFSSSTYPTSSSSTTLSGFYRSSSKTSRIMSNLNSISSSSSIHPITPTLTTPLSNPMQSSSRRGNSELLMGLQQSQHSTLDTHTATTMGLSSGSTLPSLNNFIKSPLTNNNNNNNSRSVSNVFNVKQQFPPDFTFSKNHWTNSDAAFTGGTGGGLTSLPSIGGANYRVGSSSTSSLASASSSLGSETERPRIFRNRHHHEQHWGPFFEEPPNSSTSGDNNVTIAHLYTEAVLNCRVGMLKDKTVMWVRWTTEKVSLLTVGNVTYSSDPRIRVKFQYPNNWRLLINPTQWDDAGIYMCQVSTHPPRVFTTNLTVIEPPLRLIDDQERDVGDRYYKTGSTIDLHCQVSRSFLYKEKQNILKSLKPFNIHNNNPSKNNNNNSNSNNNNGTSNNSNSTSNTNSKNSNNNNNSNNNQNKTPTNKNKESSSAGATNGHGSAGNSPFPNINLTATDKLISTLEKEFSNLVFWSKDEEELPPAALKRLSSDEKWLTSRVTITDAKLTDSGNYSCSIGRLFTAIVQVQVLTGELPAAVQHNSATAPSVLRRPVSLLGFEPSLMQFGWLIYLATAFLYDFFFVLRDVVVLVGN